MHISITLVDTMQKMHSILCTTEKYLYAILRTVQMRINTILQLHFFRIYRHDNYIALRHETVYTTKIIYYILYTMHIRLYIWILVDSICRYDTLCIYTYIIYLYVIWKLF